ncbi:MAG TPA: DUF3237 domain-containing protein [Saprospiraceae bacterium]|nr:DUF3237 domain-containing protein [Saprospiraceae bacterium]
MHKLEAVFFILFFSIFLVPFTVRSQELGLKHELLFEMTAWLDEPIEIGDTPMGKRTIYPVSGGTFKGPEINGKVLPNGGDWVIKIDSSTEKLDVRAVLETNEGEIVYTHYGGFIHWNADGSYYFRTNPVFETSSEKYAWLNYIIAVGVGELIEGGVRYKVYRIK